MGKKRRILFAILGLAILGGLAWMMLSLGPSVPDPVYEGKPLSKWLEEFDFVGTAASGHRNAARTAIQNMGTNTIPALLHLLKTPNWPWKNRLMALARKQHVVKINYVEPPRLYSRALSGLQALGPRAADAMPELVQIYDQNPPAQSSIAIVLGQIGPDAKAAVPSLLRGTDSTNFALRNNSLAALYQIHAEPDLVVPVFIKALEDPYPQIKDWAARGLGAFGTNARAAVPVLVKLLESKEPSAPTNYPYVMSFSRPSVKETAFEALRQIDPEAAAKVSTNVYRDER